MITNFDWHEYYIWLINKINCKEYPIEKYGHLLETLNRIPYIWVIPFDQNREIDGKYLRLYFMDGDDGSLLNTPCSVLEMLIAFAEKADEFLYIDRNPYKMFWLMLDNLGLTAMHDDNYDENRVINIVYGWMRHYISKNGDGGPFPIRFEIDGCDERNEEIWIQFNHYIAECDRNGKDVYRL